MGYSSRQPAVEVECGACRKKLLRAAWLVRKHSHFFCDTSCRRKGQPVPVRVSMLEVGTRRVLQGYVRVFLGKGVPGAYADGWALEHRVVMERMLGRPMLTTESVHHRNGVKTDNSEANLELWVRQQPPGQRVDDVVAHARSILALYGDEDERACYV